MAVFWPVVVPRVCRLVPSPQPHPAPQGRRGVFVCGMRCGGCPCAGASWHCRRGPVVPTCRGCCVWDAVSFVPGPWVLAPRNLYSAVFGHCLVPAAYRVCMAAAARACMLQLPVLWTSPASAGAAGIAAGIALPAEEAAAISSFRCCLMGLPLPVTVAACAAVVLGAGPYTQIRPAGSCNGAWSSQPARGRADLGDGMSSGQHKRFTI